MKLHYLVPIVAGCLAAGGAHAAVSAAEAAKLKNGELTPLGGERAGNKDGTIPEWTGGYTTPVPGFVNGGRRPDPFASEKPLLSINSKNYEQYADKLTDGTKAMLKKYPDTFRVDVYKTHRTAAAPQWLYDNTYKNATSAQLTERGFSGAYAGIPFPIPKLPQEIIRNHDMHWRGESWQSEFRGYMGTVDGKSVMTVQARADYQMPYYNRQRGAEDFNGEYWTFRMINSGPPLRAGEGSVASMNVDQDRTAMSVYLSGQRRTRKLPNACCDTPAPASAGVMSIDEVDVLSGRTDRFDWKILGKKEMYIPYNSNRLFVPEKDSDVLMAHHLNPDHVRWELHRVWVLEATVKPGARHLAATSRYYFDEDTWVAVLGDRWDANKQLWKTLWAMPVVMPDLPATTPQQQFGFYDLISGVWYASGVQNEQKVQYRIMPRYSASTFSPEALAGEGVR
jgi:hypothetical protein